MQRIEKITADALKYVDGDRYKLSLMVAKRVEELSKGSEILVNDVDIRKMKFADIALLEISQGKINIDGSTFKTDK